LKSAAKDAREIFLATDPDREGEAIAWHVAQQIKTKNGVPVRRVLFHEITRDAVQAAIANAGKIDERKVDAQQARRVLDRLVGYKASPVLWKTVKKGISAGRVQTVALRLLVEREREIRAFKPVEYWTVEALLEKDKQQFTAKLHLLDGKKPVISNETDANEILSALKARKTFEVTEVKRRERRKNPGAPFTTSTLQQEASRKLRFAAQRTMRAAQRLYENGFITYMRTDSTTLSKEALSGAAASVAKEFGREHVLPEPRLYATKVRNAVLVS
jgi:DNA topoisomerase-1